MNKGLQRKLAAIMFTDIAGYTELTAKDENKALEILDIQKKILHPIIKKFNGTLHKEIGDGLLFTFETVTDAIKCGIEIQAETKSIEYLNIRIGIHEGEITLKNGDALGDDVNVASRIEAYAAIGGIAISGKVQQNISSLTEFKTKFVSQPILKGISQNVTIYCLISHDLPETDITKVTAKLERDVKSIWLNQKFIFIAISLLFILIIGIYYSFIPKQKEKLSIGIFMIENICDNGNSYWENGYYEDLIMKIANSGHMNIYKIKSNQFINIDDNQIAKEIGVSYILRTNICKNEETLELRYNLYNKEVGNIIGNKFSATINESNRLLNKMIGDVFSNIYPASKNKYINHNNLDINPQALEIYYKALEMLNQYDKKDDLEEIKGLFSSAIKIDPYLIKARRGLFLCNWLAGNNQELFKIAEDSYSISKQNNDTLGIITSLGMLSKTDIDFDRKIKYLNEGISLSEKNNSSLSLANLHALIGDAYMVEYIRSDDKGEHVHSYKLRTTEFLEKMIYNYKLAINLYNINDMKAYHLFNGLADLYREKGYIIDKEYNFNQALIYYQKALENARVQNLKYDKCYSLLQIGALYVAQNKYSEANVFLIDAYNIHQISEVNNASLLWHALGYLSNNYAHLNKKEQFYKYSNEYVELSNKLGDYASKMCYGNLKDDARLIGDFVLSAEYDSLHQYFNKKIIEN